MKVFIVVRDVDLGVHVFGTYTTRDRAAEAITEFCFKEYARFAPFGIECSTKEEEFYLLESEVNGPMDELEMVE
jgi:hypothetical protein